MARKRSAEQRLIDNLQRKIRHLRVKENKAKAEGNEFDKAGFERNKKNIQKMIDDIRKDKKKGDLDQSKLFEYAEKAKENPNYSADKKKIRKQTKKLISSEPEDLFEDEEDFDADEDYSNIMGEYASLSGKYVGQSGDGLTREKARVLLEKIFLTQDLNGHNMTEQQINILNKMSRQTSARLNSKGWKGVVVPIS